MTKYRPGRKLLGAVEVVCRFGSARFRAKLKGDGQVMIRRLTRRGLLRVCAATILLRSAVSLLSATAASDEDFVVVNGWILKASDVGHAAR